MGIHIHIFNDAQNALVKQTLADAETTVLTQAKSEVQKLEATVTAQYPAVATAFKAAFNELENDTTVTGFARMVKAAELVVPQIPEIAAELANLSNLKSFLVGLGQTIWNDTIEALVTDAKEVGEKILAIATAK